MRHESFATLAVQVSFRSPFAIILTVCQLNHKRSFKSYRAFATSQKYLSQEKESNSKKTKQLYHRLITPETAWWSRTNLNLKRVFTAIFTLHNCVFIFLVYTIDRPDTPSLNCIIQMCCRCFRKVLFAFVNDNCVNFQRFNYSPVTEWFNFL